jgi:hypothetical protein
MVDFRRSPATGGVAGSAIAAISAFVRVLCLVAGVAVLRGSLEIRDRARVGMAIGAANICVLFC